MIIKKCQDIICLTTAGISLDMGKFWSANMSDDGLLLNVRWLTVICNTRKSVNRLGYYLLDVFFQSLECHCMAHKAQGVGPCSPDDTRHDNLDEG